MKKCYDIYMAELPDISGSVQNGYRPVLIISNDKANTYSTILNVIQLSSKTRKKDKANHVIIEDYEKCGLRFPSILLIEQITTISSDRIGKYVGTICDKSLLSKIKTALCVQFPIML